MTTGVTNGDRLATAGAAATSAAAPSAAAATRSTSAAAALSSSTAILSLSLASAGKDAVGVDACSVEGAQQVRKNLTK